MVEPDVRLSDIGAFVPFPTALFDDQMPKLKDTEWRLLCVNCAPKRSAGKVARDVSAAIG